jgi:hypothetical protein
MAPIEIFNEAFFPDPRLAVDDFLPTRPNAPALMSKLNATYFGAGDRLKTLEAFCERGQL